MKSNYDFFFNLFIGTEVTVPKRRRENGYNGDFVAGPTGKGGKTMFYDTDEATGRPNLFIVWTDVKVGCSFFIKLEMNSFYKDENISISDFPVKVRLKIKNFTSGSDGLGGYPVYWVYVGKILWYALAF